MFEKILYIGAGTHLDVLEHFPETKRWIFVDSLPRNSYGYDYYYRGFYREDFLPRIKGKFIKLGYNLESKKVFTDNYSEILVDELDSSRLIYTKDDKRVSYYYSTGIPNDVNKILENDISTCDTLLLSGHHPNKEFVEYMQKPFHVICYNTTYFPKDLESMIKEDPEDEKTILGCIFKHPEVVKDYTLIKSETGEIETFKNYSDFYENL